MFRRKEDKEDGGSSRRSGRRSGMRIAMMLHPVNGRQMFDRLEATEEPIGVLPTPALAQAMQSRLRELLSESSEFSRDAPKLQRQVVEEFGFSDVDVGVRHLVAAVSQVDIEQDVAECPASVQASI
eukprot:TRINITY_DN12524_c0_g2_i4.p1 TRINITY_DN12524_c0_g2~~TRINITY_DN12524_c0_g2_i4.p1  ORF type:complete len:126 (+),score=23.89 TRINITY_DN12524_c0_g2_i4:516-893(+)